MEENKLSGIKIWTPGFVSPIFCEFKTGFRLKKFEKLILPPQILRKHVFSDNFVDWISSKIWKHDYLSSQLHKIWCAPVFWHEKSFENGFETVRAVFVAEFGDFGIFCGFLSHLSLYIVLFSMMFLHFPPERANFAPFFMLNSNLSNFLFLNNF